MVLLNSSYFWENFPYSTWGQICAWIPMDYFEGCECSINSISLSAYIKAARWGLCSELWEAWETPREEWPQPAASYTYQVVLTRISFSTIPLRSNGEFMTKSYLLSLSSDISIAQKNIWSLRKQTQEMDIWFSCSQTIALILSSRVKRARPDISYGKACCSVQLSLPNWGELSGCVCGICSEKTNSNARSCQSFASQAYMCI